MNFSKKGRHTLLPTPPNLPRVYGPNRGNQERLGPVHLDPSGQSKPIQNKKPYFSDPLVLSRVSQYLQTTGKSLEYVDIDHMLNELQNEYKEYRRRKRSAFKLQLKKALEYILFNNEINIDDDNDEVIDDDNDDEGDDEYGRREKSPDFAYETGDGDVNSALEESYLQMQQNMKRRKLSTSTGQELISIVTSDEDDNDDDKNKPRGKVKYFKKQVNETYQKLHETPMVVIPKGPETPIVHVKKPVVEAELTAKKRKADVPQPCSKRLKSSVTPVVPTVAFKDIGGNQKVLEEVTQLLIHLRHPEVYRVLGVSPPRGFLLHGPPGSGKTLLAHAICGELKLPLVKVAAPELVGGLSGQSEERIRELFEQAVALAPCVLFIDEVDAITPNRETAHREMEKRIVAQLLSSMDELANKENGDQVLVIGATNRPDSLDPALRRAGRFDREVCLGIPDRESRGSILCTLCRTLRLDPDLQLSDVAIVTPGFVGADLKSLVTEAAMAAVNRLFHSIQTAGSDSKSEEPVRDDKQCVEEAPGEEDSKISVDDDDVTVVLDKREEPSTSEGKKQELCNGTTHEKQCVEERPETEDNKISVDDDDVTIVLDKRETSVSSTSQEKKPEICNGTTDEEKESKDEDMEVEVVSVINEDTNSNDLEMPKAQVDVHSKDRVVGSVEGGGEATPPSHSRHSLIHSPPLTVEQLQGVFITREDFEAAMKVVQPSSKREGFVTVPNVRWEDIGSLQDIRQELQMAIMAPVKYPKEFAEMGLSTPTGVLLCGPPGCGKTLLAKAVANEAGINFISVKGPELLNMYVGESERAVRQCFQRARSSQPCVIFFDEIDALCPKRVNMDNGASRVVNQLLTEMDGMEARPGVFLMAATNRPDIVDPAVMRPGRLDKVLYVGLPAAKDREEILQALTKGGKKPLLAEDVNLAEISVNARCEGYTGADLAALVREASMQAINEFMADSEQPKQLTVCSRHFTLALNKIRPSVTDRDKKRYEDLRLLYAAVPATG